MRYLLGTSILSELVKRRPNPYLIDRLRSKPPESLLTSCVCVMELRFGSMQRKDSEVFWDRITSEILSRVRILPFDFPEAVVAGEVLSSLRKAGQMLGTEDVLIASTASSNHCVMVTANVRHFSRLEALSIANRLEPR